MPNILDAFVITLGLDATGYLRGAKQQQEALDKTKQQQIRFAKETEERGKQAAQFFTGMRKAAIELFAAFEGATGITKFFQSLQAGNLATANAAPLLNMSAHALGTWEYAARKMQGTAQGMRNELLKLQSDLSQAETGTPPADTNIWQFFGINLQNPKYKDNPGQLFLDLAQSVQNLRSQGHSVAEFSSQLAQLVPQDLMYMVLHPEQFGKVFAEANKQAPTDETYRRVQDFHTQWENIVIAMQSAGSVVLDKIEPAIDKMAKGFTDWVNGPGGAKAIDTLGGDLDYLSNHIDGVTKGAEAFAAIWAGSKLMAMLAGIARIGGALNPILLGAAALWYFMPNEEQAKKNIEAGKESPLGEGKPGEKGYLEKQFDAYIKPYIPSLKSSYTKEKQEADIKTLMSFGATRAKAQGIVANAMQESSGNEQALGDNGLAVGLFQLHPTLQAEFQKIYGHTVQQGTRSEQLEFAYRHAAALRQFQAAQTPEQAAEAFSLGFERPAGGLAEANRRMLLAADMFGNLGPGTAAAASSTTNNSNSSKTDIHVGPVNINNPKDAADVAKNVADQINQALTVYQSNTGQN